MRNERKQLRMNRKNRTSLTLLLSLFVFAVLGAAIGLAVLGVYILEWTGVMAEVEKELGLGAAVLFMSVISFILGWVLVFFSIRIPLKPIHVLVTHMNHLAAGDFTTRIQGRGALAHHPYVSEVNESFNKLAEELEHTEMLRGDFINNFSHEFKTPIVSIAGFAKLLRRESLTDEQKNAYLASIEEESVRLAAMATNVLNLTKVENQSILTDVTTFNLSEQVRSAVLLLETKWTEKTIEPELDFDEYTVEGNEELLKEVWINLVDNAIKFSPHGGKVTIHIHEMGWYLTVSVGNQGSDIPDEQLEKIFHKFYQGDESHASDGNGLGLAIAKRIVDLHRGSITVTSGNGTTVFSVSLPLKQKK